MKVIDQLKKATKTQFSFEVLPPLKGGNIDSIYRAIDPLIEFNPININVTYHQQEVVYKKLENGLLEKRTIRKRPGSVAIAAAIKFKYKVTVVPHIICGGFDKDETEDTLIDFNFLGMNNLLALRGDPPKSVRFFIPEENGHTHTSELVKQIKNMNRGIYLDEKLENPTPTDFCVGVAGYPEKHYEAPNMENDLLHLKEKVDAGADYIVTQMFFNNKYFFEFVEKCRKIGITVPIVPGIKPIMTLKDISVLPKIFSIEIPEALVREVEKCKTNQEAWQVGIEWTIRQSKELAQHGVPAIHYYTYGTSENIKEIAKAVF